MSIGSRAMECLGHAWARVEALFWRLVRRFRHRPTDLAAEARTLLEAGARQLGEEARALGEEAREIGREAAALAEALWDRLEDLPLAPSAFRISPVRNQFYGHGAFMGAAPALLADTRWRRILAFLMPDVYADIEEAVRSGEGPPRFIPMFENNPVMCAFGVVRSFASRLDEASDPGDLAGMEWDVFVDGDLVEALERAEPAERPALLARITDGLVIAHASSADTVQEAMGICQYRDVRKTRKTHLGGVEFAAWLDLFARSLELDRVPDLDGAIRAMAREDRVVSEEQCVAGTFASPRPPRAAVEAFQAVTGRRHLSIVLEIKSLRSTPAFLGDLVAELNRRGLHVAAVCAFLLDEIRGVSGISQEVDGERLPGPREILFFHYAGDLQLACDAGEVPAGQAVLFNGASLLQAEEGEENGPSAYRVKEDVVADLAEYRARHDLQVGLYVQEGDCDEAAAGLLSDLVGREPSTFRLGFAWGGLRDEVAIGRAGSPRLGYGAQRRLGMLGKARQWRVASASPAPRPVPTTVPTSAVSGSRPPLILVRPSGPEIRVDPSAPPTGVEGPRGSLLSWLLSADVPVEHACGGVGACGTCHVLVRGPLPPADDDEEDILDKVPGTRPTSRLACRCMPDGRGDLEVEIPSWNRNLARERG